MVCQDHRADFRCPYRQSALPGGLEAGGAIPPDSFWNIALPAHRLKRASSDGGRLCSYGLTPIPASGLAVRNGLGATIAPTHPAKA
jgi:hypothetical protein